MTWKKVDFGFEREFQRHNELLGRFFSIFVENDYPPDAAMFGNLQPHFRGYVFYFSPKAAEIAEDLLVEFGAVDCEQPNLQALQVHAVNDRDGTLHK